MDKRAFSQITLENGTIESHLPLLYEENMIENGEVPELEIENESKVEVVTFGKKVRKWIILVNVYPVLMLAWCSYGLFYTVLNPFLYWSRCIELNAGHDDPEFFCHNMTGTPQEHDLQLDIATLHLYRRIVSCLPALLVSPALGAWSDGTGGRMVGGLFCSLIYKSVSIYPWLLLSWFITGITGYGTVEYACIFAMITDDARTKDHESSRITFLVSVAVAVGSASDVTGSLLASVITAEKSTEAYFFGFLLAVILFTCAFLYAWLIVHDTYRQEEQTSQSNQDSSFLSILKHIKDETKIRSLEVLETLRRPRIGYIRFCLNLTIACAFVEMLALDNGLLFLFVKRAPFSWSDYDFSTYVTATGYIRVAGTCFWPLFFVKCTKFIGKDLIMAITGLAALTLFHFILSWSVETWMIVFAGGLSFFIAMVSPGFRCFIPKLVQQNETGRIYTAFGIASLLAPILSSLVFNNIYKATLEVYAGFAFLVAALMQCAVLGAMIIVHVLMLRTWRLARSQDFHDDEILVNEEDDDDLLDVSKPV